VIAALLPTLLFPTALSQDAPELSMNAQLYRPAIASPHFLWTDESGVSGDGGFSARAAVHGARDPVVYRSADGERVALLDDVVQTDLSAAWRARRLLVGANLPAVLRATSDVAEPQTSLGDVAGELRVSALYRDTAPVGLAFGVRGWFPTAQYSGAPAGLAAPGATFEGQVIVDRYLGGVLLAANAGYRRQPEAPIDALAWDDQLVGRLGAAWSATDAVGLSLDFAGQAAWSALDEPATRPMEVLGGGWVRLGPAALRAGVGTGLGSGVGAPRLRGVLALDLLPVAHEHGAAAPVISEAPATPAPTTLPVEVTPAARAELSVRVMDSGGATVRASVQLIHLDTAASWLNRPSFEVAPGAYTVFVEAPGYAAVRQEIRLDAEQQMVVDVVLEPSGGR